MRAIMGALNGVPQICVWHANYCVAVSVVHKIASIEKEAEGVVTDCYFIYRGRGLHDFE